MKTNLILSILTATIVITLNFPGVVDEWLNPLQVTAATVAVFVLLIIYQISKVIKKNTVSPTESGINQSLLSEEEKVQPLPAYQEGLMVEEFICTIMDAYLNLPEEQGRPDESEKKRLLDELDIYRQSYLWCVQMQRKYGQQWADAFQGATLPLTNDDYPRLRSLIAEIALQTSDFCRYRTNDVNLQERMMVNPKSMLLDCSVEQAGACELEINPFNTPKEVLALYELFSHDEVSLKQASIHGYIQHK